jgi:hypothetical protein
MNWLTDKFSEEIRKRSEERNRPPKPFDEIFRELGVFKYDDSGFTIEYEDFAKRLKWIEITQINAYKTDLYTTDRVDMEIVYSDRCFTISEELPGWYQFVIKLKEVFPDIPNDWDTEIIYPAFAANYRTIYERQKQEVV